MFFEGGLELVLGDLRLNLGCFKKFRAGLVSFRADFDDVLMESGMLEVGSGET